MAKRILDHLGVDPHASPLARIRTLDDAGAVGKSQPDYESGDRLRRLRNGVRAVVRPSMPGGPEWTPCGAPSARATVNGGLTGC